MILDENGIIVLLIAIFMFIFISLAYFIVTKDVTMLLMNIIISNCLIASIIASTISSPELEN